MITADANAGKKHCQGYLKKLDNIKAQQRQGNSISKSNSLAKKESKARKVWWQCETGKLKKKSKKGKKTSTSVQANKQTMTTKRVKSYQVTKKLVPFSSNKAIVAQAPYQGDRLYAWLDFYQQPKECSRPKSTQVFAKCMEDKRLQQQKFEQKYVVIK